MDMRYLMKQAQAMQQKLQEAQVNLRAEGTSGGECVKITVNGAKEVVSVSIAKDVVDPEDVSMLEDLILAAYKDASAKADEAMGKITGGMTGGMNIPGLKF
ncbi:MAG TPA: YbaB/EbfC family nucleoid-associated protein [Holophaga sp.]|jgi:DNA-binding YbaB/EbfC family protein|nr:YbaB/EbfC family nucleoid-associated protein [Holophaga sp.]